MMLFQNCTLQEAYILFITCSYDSFKVPLSCHEISSLTIMIWGWNESHKFQRQNHLSNWYNLEVTYFNIS